MAKQISTNVFTYGSLMYPQVINNLVTRKDYQSEAGTLQNFTRKHVSKQTYPGLVRHAGSKVQGILYHDITKEDLQILNKFEGDEYEGIQVQVTTTQGKSEKALVYLYRDVSNLEEREWDIQDFQKNHKHTFALARQDSQQK